MNVPSCNPSGALLQTGAEGMTAEGSKKKNASGDGKAELDQDGEEVRGLKDWSKDHRSQTNEARETPSHKEVESFDGEK